MTTPDEPLRPDRDVSVRPPLHRSLDGDPVSTTAASARLADPELLPAPQTASMVGAAGALQAAGGDAGSSKSRRVSPLIVAAGAMAGLAAVGGFALFAQGDTPSSSRALTPEPNVVPADTAESDDPAGSVDADTPPDSTAGTVTDDGATDIASTTITAAPATTTPVAAEPTESADGNDAAADASTTSEGATTPDAPGATATTDSEVPGALVAGPVEESKAVVRGGQMFFSGAVPTAEIGEEIVGLAIDILGAENVFNNYVVDPAASDPNLGNIIVEDTITFAPDSAILNDSSTGLLLQGFALMTVRPAMTVTVVGHTDSAGNSNLELSQLRADSVKQWFIDQGIDPDRIDAVGRGASDPIASNDTAEGRSQNRRIQFILENVLGE